MALERLYWFDWLLLAFFSLGVTLLWMVLSWAFRLWRYLEIAIERRVFQPLLGAAAICSTVFAMCVVVYQLAYGLRPCFDDFIERPGFLFGCYIFSDKPPVWPDNDLRTYLGLAILTAVIVCTRIAFRHWRRG